MAEQLGWTDTRVDALCHLWADPYLTTEDIAEVIGGGLNRNAVIGKANRLKRAGRLPCIAKPIAPRKPRPQSIRNAALAALAELDAYLDFSAEWPPCACFGDPAGFAKALAMAKAVLDRAQGASVVDVAALSRSA